MITSDLTISVLLVAVDHNNRKPPIEKHNFMEMHEDRLVVLIIKNASVHYQRFLIINFLLPLLKILFSIIKKTENSNNIYVYVIYIC